MINDDRPVSVVTGANSGIGRATAVYLAQQGHRVFGSVRRLDSAAKLNDMAAAAGAAVELFQMDVASADSVATGLAGVLEVADRIDNLVNNAGVGGNAVAEECPTELYLDVFNVNVCGAARCIQAVLPQMRERRAGCIVNITSIAGRIAAIGQQPYFVSKWAFEGFSEGLAQEVAPFGIRVAIVEPGVTKSAIFAKNVDTPADGSGAYVDHYNRLLQFYAVGRAHATDPFEVGAVVHEAITTGTPKLRYRCSWGGEEIIAGRAKMTDEEWVALGALDDAEYYAAFERCFGLDIAPPA